MPQNFELSRFLTGFTTESHMQQAATGLTELKTEELKKLLGHLHREELDCPITTENLARVGFQHRHDYIMGAMRNLDGAGVRAVLVCVIAERPKPSSLEHDDSFLF